MNNPEERSELAARLEALETSVEADIEDVRDRVIQVKRETDEKAPTDHDHPGLAEDLQTLETTLESLEADLDRTEDRLDGGFDNFEEILEELFDRTETVEEDLDAIGQALQSMQETVATVARRERRRARADHLKRIAAKRGVRTANCEDCNATVDIVNTPASSIDSGDSTSLEAEFDCEGTGTSEPAEVSVEEVTFTGDNVSASTEEERTVDFYVDCE